MSVSVGFIVVVDLVDAICRIKLLNQLIRIDNAVATDKHPISCSTAQHIDLEEILATDIGIKFADATQIVKFILAIYAYETAEDCILYGKILCEVGIHKARAFTV